ncbi:MAG: hypothetical protein IJW21_07135 [Clostridia bacterium]|nr:hypothetical protein [Clostridia bacterium]
MNKLNTMFLNEYSNLEALFNAKYELEEGGVAKYVDDMREASDSKDKIDKWAEDYHTLSKCMHIYNVISLHGNKLRKPQCTKQDIAWLKKFAQRFEKETDSLARLAKYESAVAKFNETMQKIAPVAKSVAIACGVALVLTSLIGDKKDSN